MSNTPITACAQEPSYFHIILHQILGAWTLRKITIALRFLATFILIFTASPFTHANSDLPPANPIVTQLSTDNGLISSTINDIAQDPSGMMWFATEQGLNRYDGYEMKLFGSRPGDPLRNIGRSRILSLYAGEKELWVGTDYLVRFDYATETFEKFHVSSDMGIYAIKPDKHGKLWVGGYQFGLKQIDPKNGDVIANYQSLSSECSSDDSNIIRDMEFANDGRLWLATSSGVCIFDPNTKQFTRPLSDLETQNIHATNLAWDKNNQLWITAQQGLFRTNSEGIIQKFDTGDVPVEHIKSILVDSQQRIWVGLDRDGVLVIDSTNDTHVHIQPKVDTPFSLEPAIVFSIFESRDKTIWISVKGYGLYVYDSNKQLFDLFFANKNTADSLSYPQVLSITSDQRGSVWVATDGGGLYQMDEATESFSNFKHIPDDPSSLRSDAIIGLSVAGDGTIWTGSWAGGLSQLDPQTGIVKSWHVENTLELWTDNIFTLYRDSHNQLWLSTWDYGVQVFDLESQRIVHSYKGSRQSNSLLNVNVMAMLESRDGGMWLGGYSGLELLDKEGRFVERFGITGNNLSLSGSTVYSVHEDVDGILWIGTNEGLNILDRKSGSIKYVTTADGLPGKAIYGILEDEDGDIWVSTNRGLALYYSATGNVQKFSTVHGLQGNEFNRFSFHKSGNNFYFGGVNGFNRFNPSAIKHASHDGVDQIILTDFLISNRSIAPGTHYALPKAISHTKAISLKPDDSVFSIEFATVAPSDYRPITYRYRMDGFDSDWIETGSDNRRATYTGLPFGKYVFRVQVLGANKIPLKTETSIIIQILPRWWESGVFKSSVIVLLLALVWLAYHLRVKSMVQRMESQQKAREASLYLAKNRKLETLNTELAAVNQSKDDLLRIVAHDLRNPLAGLHMGLELMIIEHNDRGVSPTRKSLERLMGVVQSMLGIADKLVNEHESDALAVELHPVSLAHVVRLITEQNSAQASLKEITFTTNWGTNQNLHVLADKTLLCQALDNLISNAIKYSYPKSNITITIAISSQQTSSSTSLADAFISITDQGQGMSVADIESAFQAHTQLSASPTNGETSHGMGLFSARKVIEAMNGTISVESKGTGYGTTFTIILSQPEH